MTQDELQKKYPIFFYDSFEHALADDKLEMKFYFHCGEHQFVTTDTISCLNQDLWDKMGPEDIDHYVFQIGLAEIPSYWKAFLSPTVQIACGYLSEIQERFWEKLFLKGMGEFFFVNQIAPFSPKMEGQRSKIKGPETIAQDSQQQTSNEQQIAVLVPVGGGKDSVVALELLAKAGAPISTCSAHQGAAKNVIATFRKRQPLTQDIIFSRALDPKLLELNKAGHPNGHTPFSAVLAFLTLFIAKIFGIPFIALANEHSANEATLEWNGIFINHQYSKSYEFETDFRNYVSQTLDNAPQYFSLLRPLYELQIVKLFAGYPPYFEAFKSCNLGQKTNTWCGKCPKCTFVALMLSAFLPDTTITQVFQIPILSDLSLTKYMDQLIGIAEEKPFECVGTRTESQSALYLALQKRKDQALPSLLAYYETWVNEREIELARSSQAIMRSFETQHNVPDMFVPVLKDAVSSL